jgi:hypothetical protein
MAAALLALHVNCNPMDVNLMTNIQGKKMFKELPKVFFIVMVSLWFFDSKPNLTKKDNVPSCGAIEHKK